MVNRILFYASAGLLFACLAIGCNNSESLNSKCLSCNKRFQIDGQQVTNWGKETQCPHCGAKATFSTFYSNGTPEWNKIAE